MKSHEVSALRFQRLYHELVEGIAGHISKAAFSLHLCYPNQAKGHFTFNLLILLNGTFNLSLDDGDSSTFRIVFHYYFPLHLGVTAAFFVGVGSENARHSHLLGKGRGTSHMS